MEIIDAPYRKQPRLKNYNYSTNGAYFITVCASTRGKNVFSVIEYTDLSLEPTIVLTDAGKTVNVLIQNIDLVYPGVHVDTYCIMPDHIHLLLMIQAKEDGPPRAAAPTANPHTSTASIPKIINSLKSLTTKRCEKPIWQRGYYEHIVRCEEDLNQIREYIANNPRKKVLLDCKEL